MEWILFFLGAFMGSIIGDLIKLWLFRAEPLAKGLASRIQSLEINTDVLDKRLTNAKERLYYLENELRGKGN